MTPQAPARTTLPYVIEADGPGDDLTARLAADRAALHDRLVRHGAVLFRGYTVGGVPGMDAAVRALSGEPLAYEERSSPRSTIEGRVYTSTDYPADEEIFLHNENSYQAGWPRTLFFYCVSPPGTRGATPLADVREVYRLIDPAIRDEFARRRWMVVRNFHPRIGTPWQRAFNTGDRAVVEAYCARSGLRAEWHGDALRTTAVRDAVHVHPDTGVPVWFNHATFFHVTTLAPDVREGLLELFTEEELPTNTYYGDGGRIPDEVMDHLRSCYRAATVRFDWQLDDLLVVDNMTAAHGREPFTGPRRIAVAMAEAHHGTPVAS
ncbi:TauD/TfdA family dioxygenase [Catenuloplanes indicus]|uniref:Alpha-ketoglutarate-dependent taurine dioxygenase n=1 Tax=Catenuloplanes indicus TaxID=137267 RepID=A0AAE4AVF4_9ACTN|nr:TauD/TfdA family dioxygenase [Catenuloplanes indicus]MDQ0363874.1 alpha-ketoglutarate-dependent taurine dioxygenase [Catenuloplanes indicus]